MGSSQEYVVTQGYGAPKKPFNERVTLYLYDKDKGLFCGRTCKSWALISIFYLVLYAVLAGMFTACLWGLFAFTPVDEPRYSSGYNGNPILQEPGMKFTPQDVESGYMKQIQTLSFSTSDPASYATYVDELRTFLTGVYKNDSSHYTLSCDGTVKTDPCDLSLSQFEPDCWDSSDPANFNFGFDTGNPCILLRVNKVHGWLPVEHTSNPSNESLGDRWTPGNLPLACSSFVFKSDETLNPLGPMTFLPSDGFPTACFPYCSRLTTYYPAVTMIKFHNLTRGTEMNIECHFYASNVVFDRKLGTGSTTFALNIQD